MPPKFDLLVVPMHRKDGQDQSDLSGLYLAQTPRRAARGRKDERLLLLLSIQGDLRLRADREQSLLKELADGYFQTKGSVTSALREQAERINQYLLNHNQKGGSEGRPALALLSMFVQRENGAFLAQCGPVHAFLLDEFDIHHYFDPQTAGRGLGQSQTIDIRFFQMEMRTDDLFLALPTLPDGWNENTLRDARGQKLATLRRRFLAEAGADLEAVMLAAQPGSGEFLLLATHQEVETLEGKEEATEAKLTAPSDLPDTGSWESLEVPSGETPSMEEAVLPSTAEIKAKTSQEKPLPSAEPALNWFDRLAERLGGLSERMAPSLRNFLLRMLPEETNFNLPPATMATIAAIVPLAVVLLVSVVYLQFGRGQLYDDYLAQAQSAAAAAEAREDPAEVRRAWELTLEYAARAESYDDTEDASELRLKAQSALDEMDAIERLEFQPALFGALPNDVKIVRMLATNTELFLLNSSDGSVLRAFLTGGGYQLDADFQCGPGPYGGFIVSALIDIALLPRGNPQDAALVAMDGNGNLIYCIVEERPLAKALEAPDSNWGNPQAIAIDNENLHVLDPLTNAVWLYFGDEFAFVDDPRFFFGAEVPGMQNAIDMALQGENLYLLDLDGEIAVCQFSEDIENPTTCQDPTDYTDSRPGREDAAQIEDANFLQLQTTDPPEPSVFLLDPIVPAVYQFSLKLSLVRQYRSASSLPEGVVSAFAVSPNRAIFLAFDNQIYIGFLP